MPKLIHQRNKCIGCGYCADFDPDNWQINASDGKADLLNATGNRNMQQAAITENEIPFYSPVIQLCPVKIISIIK